MWGHPGRYTIAAVSARRAQLGSTRKQLVQHRATIVHSVAMALCRVSPRLLPAPCALLVVMETKGATILHWIAHYAQSTQVAALEVTHFGTVCATLATTTPMGLNLTTTCCAWRAQRGSTVAWETSRVHPNASVAQRESMVTARRTQVNPSVIAALRVATAK